MNPLRHLADPVYVFRPKQIVRRALEAFRHAPQGDVDARTSWGDTVRVSPHDVMGRAVLHRGVHDLDVVEACWRLAKPGSLCVDVGANIGIVSAALARAAGPTGRVVSFEPYPPVLELLRRNVARLNDARRGAEITVRGVALGPAKSVAALHVPDDWKNNTGLATLSEGKIQNSSVHVDVEVCTLDDEFPEVEIRILKLDVEGYEYDVLEGAKSLLARHGIRHIVFEEFDIQHSTVAEKLRRAGYRLFSIEIRLSGPRLGQAGRPGSGYNFIATCDEESCVAAFRSSGWRCLT